MNINELSEDEKNKILSLLDQDEHYYGDYGKKFLSNSNIYDLLGNPRDFQKPSEPNIHLLMGGAFHTMILEPEKMGKYSTVESSSRMTKVYKDAEKEAGEMLLLNSDMDKLKWMQKVIGANDPIQSVITGDNVEYEVPAFGEIAGELWKGKADVVNHTEKLIVDLKTTSDITKFSQSAKRYNYDSQAYIYKQFFGYEFAFAVIDKKSGQLGFFDCSERFYETGRQKVIDAVLAYRQYYKNKDVPFNWKNYLITNTL